VTGRGNPQIGSEFDQSNVLIEEQTPSVEVFVLNIIQQDNALLSAEGAAT
jgi:hypothetical protein